MAVWVHFMDKGVQGTRPLDAALISAADKLTDKVRIRRAKEHFWPIAGR